MHDLCGSTALLTGAVGGIGPFIARALAREGINLVLAARSKSKLDTLASTLKSNIRIITVSVDVSELHSLENLLEKTKQHFSTIDILVNNAGIEKFFPYHKLHANDIQHIIDVNLVGTMILTRLILPDMLERRRGHVVNMSSLSGKGAPPCGEPYAATKAGLIAFTESLRAEYMESGVGFSVICPGFVEAGMYPRLVEETNLRAPRLLGTSSGEAVADAVLRAIKKDLPEIIVNPGPIRLLSALAEFSPRFGEWLVHRLGAVAWFKKVAEIRDRNRILADRNL
jgi:short-subunit dehydrogenase